MAEHLSEQQVRNVALYAQLKLSENDISQMTIDLNSIVSTLEPIVAYKAEAAECMNLEGVCVQEDVLAWLDLSKKLQPHGACSSSTVVDSSVIKATEEGGCR